MTRALLLICLSIALGAGAQTPEPGGEALRMEMVFWESVRNSNDPADFRAYLKQYPNGRFAPLARNRIAALTPKTPAAPPAAAVPAGQAAPSAGNSRLPQQGDAWSYRLTERATLSTRQRKYEVRVTAASPMDIVERYSIDDGRSGDSKHSGGAYLIGMGASVFSPYLDAFQDLTARPEVGSVGVADPVCDASMWCRATARVTGQQTISVPAGTFETIHVRIEHEWGRAAAAGTIWPGRRVLDVWYAPSVKRAVKFSSRPGIGTTPFNANFDLELTSFQVQ